MFAPGQHNHVKLTNVHHALCFVHWGAGALWIVSMRFRKVLCLMLRRCKVYWWESRGTLLRKSVFQPFPAFLNPFQSICKFPIVFKWQVLKIGSERILQNGSSLSLSWLFPLELSQILKKHFHSFSAFFNPSQYFSYNFPLFPIHILDDVLSTTVIIIAIKVQHNKYNLEV